MFFYDITGNLQYRHLAVLGGPSVGWAWVFQRFPTPSAYLSDPRLSSNGLFSRPAPSCTLPWESGPKRKTGRDRKEAKETLPSSLSPFIKDANICSLHFPGWIFPSRNHNPHPPVAVFSGAHLVWAQEMHDENYCPFSSPCSCPPDRQISQLPRRWRGQNKPLGPCGQRHENKLGPWWFSSLDFISHTVSEWNWIHVVLNHLYNGRGFVHKRDRDPRGPFQLI